jgi:hypothetical protein
VVVPVRQPVDDNLVASRVTQVEGMDVHSLGIQYMISAGVGEDTETAGDRLERFWPILLGTEQ